MTEIWTSSTNRNSFTALPGKSSPLYRQCSFDADRGERNLSTMSESKEWICLVDGCDQRFMVAIQEHRKCLDSAKRVFPTCTHCRGRLSMATDVVIGKERLPVWLRDSMKNPDVRIHNELALVRELKFDGKGTASDRCCENCRSHSVTLERAHRCTHHDHEVDQRDVCEFWMERKVFG